MPPCCAICPQQRIPAENAANFTPASTLVRCSQSRSPLSQEKSSIVMALSTPTSRQRTLQSPTGLLRQYPEVANFGLLFASPTLTNLRWLAQIGCKTEERDRSLALYD